MPIKSASIDFSAKEKEKTESELRKEAMNQLYKDSRRIIGLTTKIFFVSVFIYGFLSILQDVNLI